MLKQESKIEEMSREENKYNKNYLNNLLENINQNQKEILDSVNEYFVNNNDIIIIENKNYDNNKLLILSILWGTYLGCVNFFKNKNINEDDLNIFYKISQNRQNQNENINKDFIIFTSIIDFFSNLYSKLDFKENNEKLNIPKINDVNDINIKEKSKNEIKNNKINNDDINKSNLENNIIKIAKNNSKINEGKDEEKEKEIFSTCIFCIEEFKEDEIINPLLDCFKHVHGKCFANYIEHELNNNKFPIKCPLCPNEDTHEINYKIIHDCLILNDKENLINKLENISLNHLSETNPDEVSFCPTPGCSYICFYDINEYHLNCPLCKKSYCLKCKTEWHQGLTCEEYQNEKKYEENMTEEDKLNEKKFNDYIKGNKCKQCPKCKRWVEKNKGCDHITCPCGTHFCYNCGQLRDSFAPYNHRCPNKYNINKNRNTFLDDDVFEDFYYIHRNLFQDLENIRNNNTLNNNTLNNNNLNNNNLNNNNLNNNNFNNNNNLDPQQNKNDLYLNKNSNNIVNNKNLFNNNFPNNINNSNNFNSLNQEMLKTMKNYSNNFFQNKNNIFNNNYAFNNFQNNFNNNQNLDNSFNNTNNFMMNPFLFNTNLNNSCNFGIFNPSNNFFQQNNFLNNKNPINNNMQNNQNNQNPSNMYNNNIMNFPQNKN